MADTSVRCWGFDYGGMLGKGTAGGLQLTPAPVTGLSGAIHVEADYTDSCAQLGDGSWRCWGSNNYGQLGDGTTTSTPTPIVVVGGKSVPWISLAEFHSCALWADQTVSCYGYNDDGRLGDGTTTMRTTPTPVPGVTGVTQIAAGDRQSCALLGGGTLSCWGADLYALGDGNTPQLVPGISDAIKVTAGTVFACALRSAGTVSCWGQNTHGELGNGGSGTSSSTPVPVSGLADVVDIEAGYSHVCALRADRTVACWGDNAEGEVGDGSRIDRSTPTVVQGLANVAQISLGATHSCALLDGGAVVCWGDELVATTTRDADPYVGRLTPTPISF
jgi:alpha-tubulin suppressor-like RCC1 family protein